MPSFSYTGRNAKGESVKGLLSGQDLNDAVRQLATLGITPLQVSHELTATKSDSFFTDLFAEPITPLDIMMFSRQMFSLLKAGIPIMSALQGLQSFIQKKSLSNVILALRASLDSGWELSTALQQHPKIFDSFYVSMIRVGETTGMLDKVFLYLFEHLEFEKMMREQIKSALRYPLFVITAILIAMVIINLFVIPAFANMFKSFGADLPFMTKILLTSSNFMLAAWPYLLAGGFGVGLLFRSYINTRVGRYHWDRFKLKLPIAGKIIHKATMARFARSFALSSKSGIPIIGALNLVSQTVDNAFIGQKIQQMQTGIERGESILQTATHSGVFNLLVLQMIAVGEESGSLDDLMAEIADMYQRDVEYEIKTLSAQLEPILIVCLGVMVLVLALGVFLPMWDFGKVAIHKH